MYYHPIIQPELVSQSTDSTPDWFDMNSDADPEIATLARSVVFENTVFFVFADHIIDKNEHQVEQYLSVVPKCLVEDSIGGVVVLPIDEDKVGLIRVFRHPLDRWSWEAIKGHVDNGEDVRTAAARELFEEAGYSVALENLVDFGVIAPESGVIKARIHLFSVIISGEIRHEVERELGHGEMVFFSPAEIDNLIKNNQIEDASTLVILLKRRMKQVTTAIS